MTLNQILDRIKNIAEAHDQINTYLFGNVDEFLSGVDNTYSGCFLATPIASISNKELTYNFRMFFLDRQDLDNNNLQDVYSDQLQIAQDILAQIRYPKSPWIVPDTAQFEFFNGSREDYLAGVAMDFQIKVPYLSDRCVIPSSYVF
jgi:hypothetical protein